jgi:Lar family restriction alleviation protein
MTHSYTYLLQLLPCPFCGGTAHFNVNGDNQEWVECGSCGVQGTRISSLTEDSKTKLAKVWNCRNTNTLPKAYAAWMMLDDSGERAYYCLMAAYESKDDASQVLTMIS